MARSMLSFGIEYERAFSIAFCSARFPPGSGPPSFAATMIARDSFEKSLPRFASAAPFLCLIDDHLLCPDTDLLQESFVDARIFGQLGVERCHEEATLAQQDGLAVVFRQYLDLGPALADTRCADEDAAERLVLPLELEIRLEAGHLPPIGVTVDLEIHQAQMRAIEHDHPRAGAEDRSCEALHRLVEAVEPHQPHERRRLAARDDEAVQALQLIGLPDLDRVGPEASQHRRVLAEVPLHSEHTDSH